ncbi:WW domain-binding protein 11 isoform X1 [Lutzomyia longipalpis]|uniref:WW domain-binding protein 11 isoform X1 n=1 Tax=Lutzomyia longipalpis TaxID=7200 RepID=UPI00248349DD|nr:WW domain-binding protein 11 isoform X1 [Lutzomyia longipalpis]
MELSLAEIRNFMLNNGCKVTNHALVKHFKEILTNPETQSEARKQFKTYVNILATIRTEDKRDGSNEKEKYLILKSKYLHECPSEDSLSLASGMTPMSPARSISSDCDSPGARQPPPYRPPPIVSPGPSSAGPPAKIPVLEPQTRVQYKDCINEYRTAIMALQRPPSHEPAPEMRRGSQEEPPQVPPRKRSSAERSFSVEKSSSDDSVVDANKENVAIMEEMLEIAKTASENQISVKEATKKFNRIASEEEKIISPSAKKKPEKTPDADINDQDTLVSDPKAKEWLVSAARCNYQELSKLASDRPWLVKLQDPTTVGVLHL